MSACARSCCQTASAQRQSPPTRGTRLVLLRVAAPKVADCNDRVDSTRSPSSDPSRLMAVSFNATGRGRSRWVTDRSPACRRTAKRPASRSVARTSQSADSCRLLCTGKSACGNFASQSASTTLSTWPRLTSAPGRQSSTGTLMRAASASICKPRTPTRPAPASSSTGASRRTGQRPRFSSVSIRPLQPHGASCTPPCAASCRLSTCPASEPSSTSCIR